jgi:hypothetical protein
MHRLDAHEPSFVGRRRAFPGAGERTSCRLHGVEIWQRDRCAHAPKEGTTRNAFAREDWHVLDFLGVI